MAYASDVSFLFMVAGSRCAVAGWLAAPRCVVAAWQLQGVVRQRGGSALIARSVEHHPIPSYPWLACVLGTDPTRR